MTGQPILLAASIFLLLTTRSLAHRPYEHTAGTFERRDGIVVSIFEHYIDGIIFADPVSIQFRLLDGTELAHTEYVSDAALSRSRDHIDIYQFGSTFIPIAKRIQRFDGYSLSDVKSPALVLLSPFIHTASHCFGYLLGLFFAAFFFVVWRAVCVMPARGWTDVFRGLGFVLVGLGSLLSLLMLLYAPISPIILTVLGAVLAISYSGVRNRFRQVTISS